MTADFLIADYGTVCILTAQTEAARAWTTENLPDDRQTFGPCGTVVEPRYLPDILAGIESAELTLDA